MPFKTPQFPLVCNIWNLATNETSVWPHSRLPDQPLVPCQKAWPIYLTLPPQFLQFTGPPLWPFIIRLPKGTFVNDGTLNTATSARSFGDHIELPAGSGCLFGVIGKLTIGEGFPNEHIRCLVIRLRFATGDE